MMEDQILSQWLEGALPPDLNERFERSEGFETYQRIAAYSTELRVPDIDVDQMWRHVKPERKLPASRPKLKWTRVAAVIVIALGLFFGLRQMNFTESTPDGKWATFRLPDGSNVTLNARSTVEYKKWNWSSHRALSLDGEAFFEVAKGERFDVNTELGTVTVVGTKFNVKVRGSRFEVACFEGKVRVQHGSKTQLLTPGMAIAFEEGEPFGMAATGTKPAWMQDLITFNAEDLKAVVLELERRFDIDIENQVDSTQRFTGVLPANDLAKALTIVCTAYRLEWQRMQDGHIILRSL